MGRSGIKRMLSFDFMECRMPFGALHSISICSNVDELFAVLSGKHPCTFPSDQPRVRRTGLALLERDQDAWVGQGIPRGPGRTGDCHNRTFNMKNIVSPFSESSCSIPLKSSFFKLLLLV